MQRLQRVLTVLALILSLSIVGVPLVAGTGHADAASSKHDGRLGGSAASFATRFGAGQGSASSKSGVTYHSADYAAIVVVFNKDRATSIDLKPANGDWASDAANTSATDLLPTDDKSDFVRLDTGDGRYEVACHSSDLGKVFSSSDYKKLHHSGAAGDCSYLISPDASGGVSELSLSIGRAGALDRPTPTPTATAVPVPTATPDTSTFVGGDGCTYANATGAQISCPSAPSNGATNGGSTDGSTTGGSTGGGDTGTYVGTDGCTYTNVDGNQISCPVAANSPPPGATAKCNDGTYSFSAHHQGTCSGHDGVAVFYS